jgi:EAL domain-containing protein (putative c-di-GMP-specific phosphodiesterase class I)
VRDDPEPYVWYLERYAGAGGALLRTALEEFPFVIGRRPGLGLTLASPEVSQLHAEIVREGGGLAVRDLGSTNGTFLNRRPLAGSAALAPGDVLHVAGTELQVVRERRVRPSVPHGTIRLDDLDLPRRFAGFRDEVRGLIDAGAVAARFEPIVRLADGAVIAWEALTRGTSSELPAEPARLFAAAAEAGLAAELSRLCRMRAVEAARGELAAGTALFLNCHADEMADAEALVASLAAARAAAGDRPLVLEIHETAVTDPGAMARLKERLQGVGVGLAYDDFGAGQARLRELAEAPPDHLKFDRLLVAGIDRAPGSRQRLLETLVALAKDLGIATVAEGVETAGELDACRNAGFTAAQGHYLAARGRPPGA